MRARRRLISGEASTIGTPKGGASLVVSEGVERAAGEGLVCYKRSGVVWWRVTMQCVGPRAWANTGPAAGRPMKFDEGGCE